MLKTSNMVEACILLALCLGIFLSGITALQLIEMTVPPVADPRDDVTLTCTFDMGVDRLYSVKWYKDELEFFRYTPAQKPTTLSFPVAGVHLMNGTPSCDDSRCPVRLTHLGKLSSGAYRCEVSTEAPTFRIAHQTSNMTVAALPRRDPVISGLREHYDLGDDVDALCTADKSDPPAEITWFINDEEAPPSFVPSGPPASADLLGLIATSASLHLQAEPGLFLGPGAILRLRCEARVILHSTPSLSPPTRHASTSVSLLSAQAQLRNQKLEWQNSSGVTDRPDFLLNIVMVITTAVPKTIHYLIHLRL